jgi:prepilin-type N-terminal cleavage/methylation domain-containing protein
MGLRGRRRQGFTLLELAIVAGILVVLAGALVPLVDGFRAQGQRTAAIASMTAIRNAIMGTPQQPGYQEDTGQLPTTLNDLFVNPFPVGSPLYSFNRDTGRGWRGPYLLNATGHYTISAGTGFTSDYGNNGDTAILDPWGNPIVLQYPQYPPNVTSTTPTFVRLVSAGPNGILDTPEMYSGTVYPPPSARGDDIVLFLDHADSYP